jgi:anthranilate/para-aminobenzoate synthase component I
MIQVLPSRDQFTKEAEKGRILPLYAELPYMSPQQIYERIKAKNSFLLESIKGPENIARYSFLGYDPFLVFTVKNGEAVTSGSRDKKTYSKSPLKLLKELMEKYKVVSPENLPPFTGGAVGMISYDFVQYFERLPKTADDDLNIPDAHFLFIDTAAAIDHKARKTFLISCPGATFMINKTENDPSQNWGSCYDAACEKIREMHRRIDKGSNIIATTGERVKKAVAINHEMGKKTYMDIVKKTKAYIKAGDIFQANLSQRVSADIGGASPWEAYKLLSRINPSPFAGYLDMGSYVIASSSPERLVRVSGSTVETRPIAGTRPRGEDDEGDRRMRVDLLLNEKERAEHLMLIDLERNDLGKISDYSTVKVDELMITEDYSHVIHIVSNIKGTIAGGMDCFDVIRATFPGGTITGVPKVRCMEIIDELEPVTRGPYTGSIGYISFSGEMDLNIIIRTFLIKDRIAYVQAGAGIVADSDPEREYCETLKKAEALIKTLEVL